MNRKKVFYITIPMQNPEFLKELRYRKEDTGEIYSRPTRFPGIAMLEWNIFGNEEIKIVTIRSQDKNGYTDNVNYPKFKEELASLGEYLGRELVIDEEIVLPLSENKDKQTSFMREICHSFDPKTYIYMDLTYGTKVTPIGLFSSLVYAEKVDECNIKSVVYGNYAFDGTDTGNYFDVKHLYDMAQLINACYLMPKENLRSMIDELWEE